MAEQDCTSPGKDRGSTVECDKSPVSSVMKRPRSSPTLCTPHRAEKGVPLRELVANEACNEVPQMMLFNPLSMNAASEGGSCEPTSTQQVNFQFSTLCLFIPFA